MSVIDDDAVYFPQCSDTQFWADNDRVETLISLVYTTATNVCVIQDVLNYKKVSSDVMFANIYSGILRKTCTGRIYGPYIRVNFLTPVHTGVNKGVKNAPVRTGRTYGPYVRAVCTGSTYRP